jgi:hypothetical protein
MFPWYLKAFYTFKRLTAKSVCPHNDPCYCYVRRTLNAHVRGNEGHGPILSLDHRNFVRTQIIAKCILMDSPCIYMVLDNKNTAHVSDASHRIARVDFLLP